MNALISRRAAIDASHKNYDTILDFKSDGRTVADSFEDIINSLPSAQPERKRGKWEKGVGENGVTTSLFCSECNYENTRWYDWNYCPNCGADMRGEDV